MILTFLLFCKRLNSFRIEPRKWPLKLSHRISQNEAQNCYEVANFFQNRGLRLLNFFTILVSNVKKKGKIRLNFRFEAQKLLRVSDLRLDSC